jgi:hypothetical protein
MRENRTYGSVRGNPELLYPLKRGDLEIVYSTNRPKIAKKHAVGECVDV